MLRLGLSILLLIPGIAAAEGSIVIVLDVSAAVADPADGDSVRAEVVESIGSVVNEAAAVEGSPALGLRIAGAGDSRLDPCSATELVAPVAAPEATRWTAALDAVVPGGRLPLYLSVAAAINDVAALAEPRRVVVVTSGGDGCGGDPQRVAAAQAAAGAAVELRIVGLALASMGIDTVTKAGSMVTPSSRSDCPSRS